MAYQSLIIISKPASHSHINWPNHLDNGMVELVAMARATADKLIISPTEGAYSIDDLDELFSWESLRPSEERGKLAIINEAHLLNTESQNKLLKILEEPSDRTQIVLITETEHHLLDTIRSRCIIRYQVDNKEGNSQEMATKFINSSSLVERYNLAAEIAKNATKVELCQKIFDYFADKSIADNPVLPPERLLELTNLYRKNKLNTQLTLECLAIMLG